MTVSSTTNKHSYNGNGSQTAFAYTFKIFVAADIKVYLDGVLKTINTHYTLSNVGVTGGGNVTFTSGSVPVAATGNVILLRSLALTQGVDLINYGAFDANIIESAYDKLTMMVQQLQEEVSRSIRFSATVYDGGTQEVSDTVANRAGKVLAYDASGNISIAAELGDWKGNWATNTAFELRDLVLDSATNNVYICVLAHTSGTLSSDVSASKWSLVINAAAVAASAATATTKASEASTSASTASTQATNSANSATAAASSASTATTKANTATTQASTATTKASEAATSASNAATSASTASTQATNSANSATASANSAGSITSAANTATTKASEASTSASTATTKASEASTSASTASTQATNAANSATASANSATASANSASGASTSATNAASSLSTFQGIFYGSLSSAPTSSIASGDLYFDSGTNAMKVYNGSSWQVVAPTVTTVDNSTWSGTDLAVVNGGTGASSEGAARTNLGLVIGTDVLAPDGDGSGLTGLPATGATTAQANAIIANTAKVTNSTSASDLTSGTLADARFPATLPAISGANLTNLPSGGATSINGLTDGFSSNGGGLGLGTNAIGMATKYRSIGIGWNAGAGPTSSSGYNINIGDYSLYSAGAGAKHNTCVGVYTMMTSTGNYNTCFGNNAGQSITTGNYNASIGKAAQPQAGTSSNQFTLGGGTINNLRCNDTSISGLSDVRDKTNIVDLPVSAGLAFVNALRPVVFNWDRRSWYDNETPDGSKVMETWRRWKPNSGLKQGFIAQEVQAAIGSEKCLVDTMIITDDNPDELEFAPQNLLTNVIKAVQELSTEINSLKARITELEA